MAKNNAQLINQALQAAISSINLARQMLQELEREVRISAKDLPGVIGTFDGEFMVGEDSKKYQVPENYASKSVLVYGDKLKMIEEGGEKLFKQVERVPRVKVEGILAKKEGKWHAVTTDGSHRLLSAAVSYNRGEEGDEVVVVLPEANRRSPFAALESVKKEASEQPSQPQVAPPAPAPALPRKAASKPSRKVAKAARPVKKAAPKAKPSPSPSLSKEVKKEAEATPTKASAPEEGGESEVAELH